MRTANPAVTPYLYLTAGDRDPMVEQIRHLAGLLGQRGFAYEFQTKPGGHDWTEWNAQIPGCFARLAEMMEKN